LAKRGKIKGEDGSYSSSPFSFKIVTAALGLRSLTRPPFHHRQYGGKAPPTQPTEFYFPGSAQAIQPKRPLNQFNQRTPLAL
jgi:hypothetical protein